MRTPARPPLDGLKRRLDRSRAERALNPRDGFLRETFVLPRTDARDKAKEWFDRWPKQAYWTEIESWAERPGDVIEFTIRRLPAAFLLDVSLQIKLPFAVLVRVQKRARALLCQRPRRHTGGQLATKHDRRVRAGSIRVTEIGRRQYHRPAAARRQIRRHRHCVELPPSRGSSRAAGKRQAPKQHTNEDCAEDGSPVGHHDHLFPLVALFALYRLRTLCSHVVRLRLDFLR